MNKEP